MKRVLAFAILIFMIVTTIYACRSYQPTDLTAARRNPNEQIIIIEDAPVPLGGHPSSDPEMSDLAVAAFDLTNDYRVSNGLDPLIWSDQLAIDALVRSEEIEERFSHTRPNNNPWFSVDLEHMYGENLAQGYSSADDVVVAWINSPAHRENLEDSEFITCGISAWRGKDGNIYIAQEFGY